MSTVISALFGNDRTNIRIQNGLITKLSSFFGTRKTVIVTDPTVNSLYGESFPSSQVIIIPEGEDSKTMQTCEEIVKKLLAMDADPSTHLIGIGGGVVCDITGFVASVFMRGITFSFVPTTLMAQADASIGGKNGVNAGSFKNILGTITQPENIYIDPQVCSTLSEEHRINGLFEVLKYGLICDAELFYYCGKNTATLLDGAAQPLEHCITSSVAHKVRIAGEDVHDKGTRRLLNFGHTFGHALELHHTILHGFAVGYGMVIAAALSHTVGSLSIDAFHSIVALLRAFRLPLLPASAEQLVDIIRKDKKRSGDTITLAVLNEIGEAQLLTVSYDELADLCKQTDVFLHNEKLIVDNGAL